MKAKIFIIRQKQFVELRKVNKNIIKNKKAGALSVLLLGLIIIFIIAVIFVYVVDYAMYSYKRSIIAKAIDYSVCAAVQEMDINKSFGLLNEVSELGDGNIKDVFINESIADNVFFNTLKANIAIGKNDIENYTLIVMVNPTNIGINYIIKKSENRAEGTLGNINQLESVINGYILNFFDEDNQDNDVLYINGNIKTNEFRVRPYYMVFIKNYQINGLIKRRTATFVGCRAAKVERKK